MSVVLKPSNLSPQQRQAYKDILIKKVMCITSDCGFGKTVVALSAYVALKRKKPLSKLLVVCTSEGVKSTWSTEHTKWSHTHSLNVVPLIGTPKKRKELLDSEGDVYVVSYNNLKWLHETNKGKHKIKFNFVFADEGDCLKGSVSKWRSYLIKIAPKVTYKVISSATPKTREEDDYWGLCKYLDNGKSLHADTVTEFRAIYCSSFVFNNRQIWRINKKKITLLEDRIKHLFINYALSEQATVKIKTRTATIELRPESRKKYDLLQETQCINSIVYNEKGIKDEHKSLDAMTLSGKLSQLTNGFLYVDQNLRITPEMLAATTNVKSLMNSKKRKIAVDVFDDRLVAFKKLITKIKSVHGDHPIAIPYVFKHELVQLKRILPSGVDDTHSNFQEMWNNKEIPYLFLQYSRSSKSLNLQKGGFIMAFYSPTFKWVDDYQIVRRLARQGQPSNYVYAYRLYIRNTIDDIKTKRLDERFKGHSRFQKKIMKSLTETRH